VIRTFANVATADIYRGDDSKAARRVPKALWPVIRRKLDAVNRARDLSDLNSPGNHLKALKGQRRGEYAIRVNDQFRITFRFEKGDAHDVVCEDYH
jgi:toxin HigB-1